MRHLKLFLQLLIIVIFLSSCEKVIDLDLPEGEKVIYLDAWITDQPGVQTIKVLQAVSFQDQAQPAALTNASVKVTDITSAKSYPFVFTNGAYQYNPGNSQAIGVPGHEYRLDLIVDGVSYQSFDVLPRVAKIDSLTLEYKEESGDEEEGYYAELHAKDLAGATDYYWIRTYRNGLRNTYLNDMVSIDGSFYEGISDGYEFIPPFAEGVTSGEKPYQKGDEVKVVMRSVSKQSYGFMEQVINQLTNDGLFSQVLQNVPTNVKNVTPQSTTRIYGWFGTVGETASSIKVQ